MVAPAEERSGDALGGVGNRQVCGRLEIASACLQPLQKFLFHVGCQGVCNLSDGIMQLDAVAPDVAPAEARDKVVAAVVVGGLKIVDLDGVVVAEFAQSPFTAEGVPGREADFACVEPLFLGLNSEIIGGELSQGAAQAVAGEVDVAGFRE